MTPPSLRICGAALFPFALREGRGVIVRLRK
jgi:hypothetical protein